MSILTSVSVWVEQLKDERSATATYKERVRSRDGGSSCNRRQAQHTPTGNGIDTGRGEEVKEEQKKVQENFYV